MRKIDKGEPLPSFTDFVRKHHPAKWEDAKDVSRTWRQYILEVEQHYLSGYTEEPITLDSSHIDHFRKQSLFNALIFEWSNFIVDSTNETYGAKYKDNFVKTCSDNDKLINPATEDASRFFKYEVNGRVAIADGLSDAEKERAKAEKERDDALAQCDALYALLREKGINPAEAISAQRNDQ
jgi:uncharacterized protein (TIGR02646 family)